LDRDVALNLTTVPLTAGNVTVILCNELQFKSADQPQSYALTKKLTFIEWY